MPNVSFGKSCIHERKKKNPLKKNPFRFGFSSGPRHINLTVYIDVYWYMDTCKYI